jgi:hypothetical protein
MYYRYASGGQTRTLGNDAVADGFTAPWGTSDASLSRSVSIYGIATITGPGSGPPETVTYIYSVDWK